MKKSLTFLLCLFLLAGSRLAFASEEKSVRTSYICRDLDGHVRWTADVEIKHKRYDIYTMVEKAKGLYSGFKGRISWIAEMEFESAKDAIRPIRLEKRVFDDRGNMVRHEKQEFDLKNNTGICTHEDPTRNISRTKKFKFDKNVVTRLSLGLYAQKFLESRKTSEKLQMVTEEPNVYDVELRVEGKEMIEVSGRKRAAYRLCIDPQLGVLDFVKNFLPKAYAWHSTGPKFEWLRYAGLEGGINTMKVEVTVIDNRP